jgi:hypothetical protein
MNRIKQSRKVPFEILEATFYLFQNSSLEAFSEGKCMLQYGRGKVYKARSISELSNIY